MKNENKTTARATASKTGEPGPADTRNENEIKSDPAATAQFYVWRQQNAITRILELNAKCEVLARERANIDPDGKWGYSPVEWAKQIDLKIASLKGAAMRIKKEYEI